MLRVQDIGGLTLAIREFVRSGVCCLVVEDVPQHLGLWFNPVWVKVFSLQHIELIDGDDLVSHQRFDELAGAIGHANKVVVFSLGFTSDLPDTIKERLKAVQNTFVRVGQGPTDYKVFEPDAIQRILTRSRPAELPTSPDQTTPPVTEGPGRWRSVWHRLFRGRSRFAASADAQPFRMLVPPLSAEQADHRVAARPAAPTATSATSSSHGGNARLGSVSAPSSVPVLNCPNCGREHSARLRTGVTERTVICSCGTPIKITSVATQPASTRGHPETSPQSRPTASRSALGWVLLWEGPKGALPADEAQYVLNKVIIPAMPELQGAPVPKLFETQTVPNDADLYVTTLMMSVLKQQNISFDIKADRILFKRWINPVTRSIWGVVWAMRG